MKNRSLILTITIMIIASSLPAQQTGVFTDPRDGKTYKTVKIGTQIWLAENLAFRADTGCWAYGNDTANVKTYGYLYDWHTAVISCPPGWHLPKNAEWDMLAKYLGRYGTVGGKLKEKDTTHWNSPNTGASNETGFTALPSGMRNGDDGTFTNLGRWSYWWSLTQCDDISAWIKFVRFNGSDLQTGYNGKTCGYSVRCVKD